MRGDTPWSFTGTAYNNTGTLVIAAASAAPDSVELVRKVHSEDNIGTATGADQVPMLWSAKTSNTLFMSGVSSLVLHHGATTATDTAYGLLEFAQLPTANAY